MQKEESNSNHLSVSINHGESVQSRNEKRIEVTTAELDRPSEHPPVQQNWRTRSKHRLIKYRLHIHLLLWLGMTGFICAAYVLQIPKGYNQELLVLGLLYGFISLYLFSCHVSTYRVTQIYSRIIQKIFVYLDNHSSDRVRTLCYGITVICIIIATVLSFPEKQESPRVKRLIPLLGMTLFVVCSYLASVHRKAVPWNTIFTALLLQFLLALFVFRTSVGHDVFNWVAVFVEGYMHNASYGAEFLFGTAAVNANTFALNLFPVIIFFASTVQMLYYVGALQWILKKLSLIFMSIMEVSGAEAIVAAATPFIGACENALLIEPFVPDLTLSEIHQVMTCGFATVSGSTLYGYTSMGVSGQALLTSCIMSIPCSIAISKLRYPETKIPVTKEKTEINVHTDDDISNIVHAATKGASMGIQIVLMIGACVISILATLYAVNAFLTWLGRFVNIQELTLQLITGYLFVPIAWLIGADNQDLVIVGRLMATKIWSNEFIAFKQMTDTYKGQITPRSELVTTYALCGFANFGSVGMQIGVLSAIAPKRSDIISQLALSALICGSLSTWLSAAIAGMLI